MKIKQFEFSFFGVNTYVVWDPSTGDCAIIDPAMLSANECATLSRFISDNNLRPTHLINTHLHLDHTFGDEYVEQRYNLSLEAHSDDAFLGAMRDEQARRFRLPLQLTPIKADMNLKQGDEVTVGKGRLMVLDVPGHSPGSIALYDPEGAFVITGDALFRGSIGRTDLQGGDHGQLIDSIHERLLTLPPDTRVYPGHGPLSTIADEIATNPYI